MVACPLELEIIHWERVILACAVQNLTQKKEEEGKTSGHCRGTSDQEGCWSASIRGSATFLTHKAQPRPSWQEQPGQYNQMGLLSSFNSSRFYDNARSECLVLTVHVPIEGKNFPLHRPEEKNTNFLLPFATSSSEEEYLPNQWIWWWNWAYLTQSLSLSFLLSCQLLKGLSVNSPVCYKLQSLFLL